ncbi:MAG: TatD family deoxyribonuclease [Candidatus Heimdallarchaeota archaeon]|nr:TatD family deoxyribonuclease [Candidatus Heimdallarchaeota archaeon]
MSPFIDVHCHLPENYFYKDIESHLKNWKANNVKYIASMSQNYEESLISIHLAKKFPEIIPAIGIHPWKAHKHINELSKFEELMNSDVEIKNIGEIGLDFHFIKEEKRYQPQQEVFEFFLKQAEKRNLSIMLHVKGAERRIIEIMSSSSVPGKKICIHWYSGNLAHLKMLKEMDFYFSCGPALAYSPKHQEVPKIITKDRLLTESDGNVKYQGKIGHPGLMDEVVRKIAELKNESAKDIEISLWKNGLSFLDIKI